MVASVIFRVLGLAVLVGIIAMAIVLWRRAIRNPLFLPASKRKTGPLGRVRIACGVLGIALLAATTFGTLKTVRQAYAVTPVLTGQMMRVPTQPVNVETLGDDLQTAHIRLLADLLIVDTRSPEPQPVHVEQFELRWPTMRAADVAFRLGGTPCKYEMSISELGVMHEAVSGENRPMLDATVSQLLKWDGPLGTTKETSTTSRLSKNGSFWIWGPEVTDLFLSSVLSVTPPTRAWYACILLITPVAADDPLQAVSMQQYTQTHGAIRTPGFYWSAIISSSAAYRQGVPPGSFRLALYLGIPTLVLLAAAVLLSQFFRRRDLALVGMVLAMVLYVAIFDRLLVSYNLSRLTSAGETLQTRLVATGRVAATFFYRQTAGEAIRDVSVKQGSDIPPELRKTLDAVKEELAMEG